MKFDVISLGGRKNSLLGGSGSHQNSKATTPNPGSYNRFLIKNGNGSLNGSLEKNQLGNNFGSTQKIGKGLRFNSEQIIFTPTPFTNSNGNYPMVMADFSNPYRNNSI